MKVSPPIDWQARRRERMPPEIDGVLPIYSKGAAVCPSGNCNGRLFDRSPTVARCSHFLGCGTEVVITPDEWIYWIDGRPVRWSVLQRALSSVQKRGKRT